ncbi:MAG: DUF91 domain-containing protein [Gammaproteobacteria bacterium]|nr:DUF91 domain-containing protein [Gammaproteobacteria bacterium]
MKINLLGTLKLIEEFKNWLKSKGKTPNTANSYASAINQISNHYSEQIAEDVRVYNITDSTKISQIAHDYSQAGRFATEGYNGNSTWKNAIARYAEFFADQSIRDQASDNDNAPTNITHQEDKLTEVERTNFAYERDLQTTLCAQISELFPNHRIFGESNLGIEYYIGGKRIDVLLQHQEFGDLLVVELKSGIADFRAFGQISMYVGLLQQQFPEKSVSGVIVAGKIDDSLKHACLTNGKISLKTYRMSIELEDV